MREKYFQTKNGNRSTCLDGLVAGWILIIGAAEAAHLAAIVLRWPLGRCCVLFWALAGAALVSEAALWMWLHFHNKEQSMEPSESARRHFDGGETAAWILFGMLVISQIIFICMKDNGIRQGDIMVETVGSFLETDGVYQVNPMTGQAYTEGLPMRLKILCLPFLYSSICRLTGLGAVAVVRTLVPALVLVVCYGALAALGNSLFFRTEKDFARNRKGYACFMAAAALLIWTGAGAAGMDGYRLLQAGWQGVTIRSCVLMPWMLSLCIRKKWLYVPLCILAEACITWTFYGMGMCFAAVVVIALIQIYSGLRRKQ